MVRQRLISQEEKDRHNSLGLCHYYGKLRHIAKNYRNRILLAIKKQAVGIFTNNLMTLVPYKPLFVKKKVMSLG